MKKLSDLVFRFRYPLHLVLFALGFTAPWNRVVQVDPTGPNAHVWGILAANLAQLGIGSLAAPVMNPFNFLLLAAILCATLGAWLRTWGTAYLGSSIVKSGAMQGVQAGSEATTGLNESVLTDGPFGYVRNPLYIGTFLHTLAISMLMPRSGALFAIVAVGALQLWLIHGEEGFLGAKLGAAYQAYCALVPRLIPRFRRKAARTGIAAHWTQAFLGELYFWGAGLSFAIFGWRYNASLLTQCVIVSVGLGIVARGFLPKAE